jgi:starch synthase
MDMPDGLVIYVLICPELYEREGTPYGANNGRDWPTTTSASPAWAWPPPTSPPTWHKFTGARTWCMPTTGRPAWPRLYALARARTPTLFTIHNLAYQA